MLGISVEGVNLERFINKAATNGIVLYNVDRERYDLMHCTIEYADFDSISELNRELSCRIKVTGRYGARFLFGRLMRRKAFVIGAALFVVFVTVLSSSIWRIDIDGINRIEASDIIDVVNNENQGVGVFKARCDTKALELAIKKAIPDCDWVIVDINGVVMNIHVIETVKGIERTDKTPSSIISEVTGEIVSVNTMKGDQMVKPGDEVKPGDVLINGIFDRRRDEGFMLVRNAVGSVTARVTYTGHAEISLSELPDKEYTGNKKERLFLSLNGKDVLNRLPEYENYTVSEKSISLFGSRVVLGIRKYEEYRLESEDEIREKALEMLLSDAYNDAERLIPIEREIESQDIVYQYDENEKKYTATAVVTAVHTIGVRKELTEEEIIISEGEITGNE